MGSEAECVFCRIVRGEIPGERVYEDERIVAFRDIQPAAPVHVLVIPRDHIDSVSDLTNENRDLAGDLLLAATAVARQEGLVEHGFRVVTNSGAWGGQTVQHLHLHVLGGRQLGPLG